MAGAGLMMAPVTFGTSLTLTGTGAALAAGGGITSAGASISGHFIKKNISQSAMEEAEKFLVVVYTILMGFDLFKKGFDHVKEWAESSAGLAFF